MQPTRNEMRYWNQVLAPYKRADDRRAWIQLLDTAIPFVLVWIAMLLLAPRAYWATLLLALPAAGLFTRLFIIQHDCGHGSFFSSRRLNDLVGGLIGVATMFPYGYWRRTHAIHHATHGNLERREYGDVETLTVRDYLALPWIRRLGYRLYRNPFVLLGIGPAYQFLFKHRLPFDIPLAWKREWASVLRNNLALALLLVLAWRFDVLGTVLLVHVPIVLVAGSFGIWLFYVQHQFENAYWSEAESWSFVDAALKGSSFYDLPPVLRWFSGNIGFHHVHHLSSRIPNYKLKECMEEVPELQEVTRLTLRSSLACLRYRLWDEERGRMISWRELHA